ncbi:MAG: hypothetical protein A3D92_11390 [Bacteroidetes bacterium RIFCSPHIGHO2_02_FULL_44_7]|nr:MAG: hypothetical protein A3D92_11390 [Bacteroidetes bacterium RIFCSPHIGHO2_02_FULL_44_7]
MLSKAEEKQFASLIKKIGDVRKGLSKPLFDALCKIVVFPACELVLVNNKKEILLTYRKDKYWKGWHFPGGLIRFRESLVKRLKTTAKAELGVSLSNLKFLFPINYPLSKRGHSLSLVYLCKTKNHPKDGQWFKTMPKDIIPEHRELWRMVKKALKK